MPIIKCPACGSMISAQASICPRCGRSMTSGNTLSNGVNNESGYTPQPLQPLQPSYSQNQPGKSTPTTSSGVVDKANFWLKVVSFLIPLLGWILYFVFKANTPVKARECAISAWAGFGLNLLIYFGVI